MAKCFAPIQIKNPAFSDRTLHMDRMLTVRCGSCENCLKTMVNNWAFRLETEAKRHLYIHFVTLTYTPEFVPLTDSGLPTLKKSDVQKFMKRLRKLEKNVVKYFFVGEYGSSSYRPHYHAIIYGVSDAKNFDKAWSLRGESLGNCYVGSDWSNGAVRYTLKYMMKKGMIPMFPGDDREKEWRIMSNKLGLNYLSDAMINWHLTDLENRQYAALPDGVKGPLPRYFREKLISASGRHRSVFKPKDETDNFIVSDAVDYRSVQSRIENIKAQQARFERTRGQDERKKI